MSMQNEEEMIQLLKNRADLEPRLEFVNQLETLLVNRTRNHVRKRTMVRWSVLTTGIAVVILLIVGLVSPGAREMVKIVSAIFTETKPPQLPPISPENIGQRSVHQLKGEVPVGKLSNGRLVVRELRMPKDPQIQPNSIYVINLQNQKRTKLAQSSSGKMIYDAVVTGDWVIYAESTPNRVINDWRFVAIDMLDGRSYTIAAGEPIELDPPFGLTQPQLSASNGKVVWQTYDRYDDGTFHPVIRMYDFKKEYIEVIDKIDGEDTFGQPQIDGNQLVYNRISIDRKSGSWTGTIFLRDLRTGSVRKLVSGLNVTNPMIRQPYVTWVSGMHDIKVLNLADNSIGIITNEGDPQDPGRQPYPTLNNRLLTWWDGASSVSGFFLPNGPKVTVSSWGSPGGKIVGDVLYWTNGNDQDSKVEWIDISGTANEVNGKWQVSPTFEIVAKNEEGQEITNKIRGEKGRLGITDVPFTEGQNQKCMWFFWGNSEELVGKKPRMIAVNKSGTIIDINLPLVQESLGGENWGAQAHLLTFFSLPSKGLWRLDVYIEDKLYGNVVVEVQ